MDKKMDKKISVALATYNGGKYLRALLDSLSRQTYAPYELVVSDDSSTDDTLAIVNEFAQTAKFKVHVVENKAQLGIIRNFAKAFEASSGELIAYCDQDDIWSDDKLEKCVQSFKDPEVMLVMHRSEVVGADLESLGYHIPERHEVEIGEVSFPSSFEMTYGLGHQMLFNAQMYREYAWIFRKGFSALQALADNYDNQIRFLAGFNGTIVNIEDTLVKFRRHESATSDAGLVDNKATVNIGFLSKLPSIYSDEAEAISAIADTFRQNVVPRMEKHQAKLRQYLSFLEKRASMYRLRGKIYQNNPIWRRFGAYFSLLVNNGYAPKRQRGLGKRAFLVDAFVATFGLSLAQKIVALRS